MSDPTPGDGYRWATKDDVGRLIEISNTGIFEVPETCWLRGITKDGQRFICDHGSEFQYARVPVDPPVEKNTMESEGYQKWREHYKLSPPDPPAECGPFPAIPVTIRRKLEEPYMESSRDALGAVVLREVTHAEPEECIYLNGRYYPTAWIESQPGILPEQVEVVG